MKTLVGFPLFLRLTALFFILSACTGPSEGIAPNQTILPSNPTVVVSAPTILSPSINSTTNNLSLFNMSGSCTNGYRVSLSGSDTQTMICASSSFSFSISKLSDGINNFNIFQTNASSQNSASVTRVWIRDTQAPAAPTISSPSSNPYTSSDSNYQLIGSCENGATIALSGAMNQSMTCAGSAYGFTITQSTDGTYNFLISQLDVAGNSSVASTFQWIRNSTLPPTPVLSAPTTTPFYDNSSNLVIAGSCVTGNTVYLSGDATNSTACASSNFSFNVNKNVDGNYQFSIVQVNGSSLSSGSATAVWQRDTVVPAPPTVTSPASSPLINNANTLSLQGACELNATVQVSGSASQSQICSTGTYSITINNLTDGTYTYNLRQVDLAGNLSSSTSQIWTRDTAAPAVLVLLSPATNPFTSADTNLILNGTCESNSNISMSGDSAASTTCSSGNFSLNLTKNTDATYNFSLIQADAAGNLSASLGFQWIRSTSIPATPVITSPASTPFIGSNTSLSLTGTCTDTFIVELSGSNTQSQTCVGGSYTFSITQTTDGTYNFSVRQKNISNVYSASANLSWTLDRVSPVNPTITSPASSPVYTNGNSITVVGACEINATVELAGASAQTMTCISGNYSFTISKNLDFSYELSVKQTDLAGNNSGFTILTWVRDSVVPQTLILINPNANPYSSSGNLNIQGSCENSATVSLQEYTTAGRTTPTGSALTTVCTAEFFSFSFSKLTDATYYLGIKQTDLAGNNSSEINLDWVRNSTLMATPVISRGGTTVTAPMYTNTGSIILRATCTLGANNSVLTSATSVTPGSSISCAAASFGDFTISEVSDGKYSYSFWQVDSLTPANSANVTVQWIKDTVTPIAPMILSSASPYTAPGNLILSGSCEIGTTVYLAGDAANSTPCTNGNFSFSIIKSTDAIYNFSLSQTDLALNSSSSATFQWIRDSNSVPPPMIVTPSANLTNNLSSLTLSGTCNTSYLVTLAGFGSATLSNPASATQTCVGGVFSYTLTLTADSILSLTLKQTFNATDSSLALRTWIRDTAAPAVTFSVQPPVTNLQSLILFRFAANESVTGYECMLDSGSYSPCISPYTLTSVSNGSHTLMVRATDQAGNLSSAASVTWDQQAYNALAIYHLDTTDITLNSSSYSGPFEGTLTTAGSPTLIATGKFGQGRGLLSANNYSVTHNSAFDAATRALTIEGYWQGFSTITSAATGATWTLVSKNGNSSGSYGWELQLYKTGGNNTNNTRCRLQIKLTTAVTTIPILVAGGTAFKCGVSTTTWNYFAVSWSAANSGAVNFYGTPSGSSAFTNFGAGTFGNSATNLGINSQSIGLGTGGSATAWPGGIDEIRISQTARPISATPTAAFVAD